MTVFIAMYVVLHRVGPSPSKALRHLTVVNQAIPQVKVVRLYGLAFAVYSNMIHVMKHADQISLACLLQGQHGCALDSVVLVWVKLVNDLFDQTQERCLSNQQFVRLLVALDLSQCNSAGSPLVWFAETALPLSLGAYFAGASHAHFWVLFCPRHRWISEL